MKKDILFMFYLYLPSILNSFSKSANHDAVETEFFHVPLLFQNGIIILNPIYDLHHCLDLAHQLTLYYTFPHIGCAVEPPVKEILVLPVVQGDGNAE